LIEIVWACATMPTNVSIRKSDRIIVNGQRALDIGLNELRRSRLRRIY